MIAGRRALLTQLLSRGFATCDDVRKAVHIPSCINPKCLGLVPHPLVYDEIIVRIGWTFSERPTAHRRPISVWKLVNRTAAETALRSLPVVEIPSDEEIAATRPKQKSLFREDEGGAA